MSNDILSMFALGEAETRFMFSCQKILIIADIEAEKDVKKKLYKEEWLSKWEKSIGQFLESEIKELTYRKLINDRFDFISEAVRLSEVHKNNKMQLNLIIFELGLFSPYYPLEKKNKTEKTFFKEISSLISSQANLKYYDIKVIQSRIENICFDLGVPSECVKRYGNAYTKSINGISGTTTKIITGVGIGVILCTITAGLAVPAIAAMVAPAGLYGAAAYTAGLAALGGGAIAAGGMGMAGGIAVIVGGGALLGVASGAGAGVAVNSLFQVSSKYTLSQAAKLEVIMKEIIMVAQKDVRCIQEILINQRKLICDLENELMKLKMNQEQDKNSIKNLKESIDILKKFIKRNESF